MERPPKRMRIIHSVEVDHQSPDFVRREREATNRLKSHWEALFEKYGHEDLDQGDEIDLVTGEIVVDRGHLRSMKDEWNHNKAGQFLRHMTDMADELGDPEDEEEQGNEEEDDADLEEGEAEGYDEEAEDNFQYEDEQEEVGFLEAEDGEDGATSEDDVSEYCDEGEEDTYGFLERGRRSPPAQMFSKSNDPPPIDPQLPDHLPAMSRAQLTSTVALMTQAMGSKQPDAAAFEELGKAIWGQLSSFIGRHGGVMPDNATEAESSARLATPARDPKWDAPPLPQSPSRSFSGRKRPGLATPLMHRAPLGDASNRIRSPPAGLGPRGLPSKQTPTTTDPDEFEYPEPMEPADTSTDQDPLSTPPPVSRESNGESIPADLAYKRRIGPRPNEWSRKGGRPRKYAFSEADKQLIIQKKEVEGLSWGAIRDLQAKWDGWPDWVLYQYYKTHLRDRDKAKPPEPEEDPIDPALLAEPEDANPEDKVENPRPSRKGRKPKYTFSSIDDAHIIKLKEEFNRSWYDIKMSKPKWHDWPDTALIFYYRRHLMKRNQTKPNEKKQPPKRTAAQKPTRSRRPVKASQRVIPDSQESQDSGSSYRESSAESGQVLNPVPDDVVVSIEPDASCGRKRRFQGPDARFQQSDNSSKRRRTLGPTLENFEVPIDPRLEEIDRQMRARVPTPEINDSSPDSKRVNHMCIYRVRFDPPLTMTSFVGPVQPAFRRKPHGAGTSETDAVFLSTPKIYFTAPLTPDSFLEDDSWREPSAPPEYWEEVEDTFNSGSPATDEVSEYPSRDPSVFVIEDSSATVPPGSDSGLSKEPNTPAAELDEPITLGMVSEPSASMEVDDHAHAPTTPMEGVELEPETIIPPDKTTPRLESTRSGGQLDLQPEPSPSTQAPPPQPQPATNPGDRVQQRTVTAFKERRYLVPEPSITKGPVSQDNPTASTGSGNAPQEPKATVEVENPRPGPTTSMGVSNRPLAPATSVGVAKPPLAPATSMGVSNRPLAPATSVGVSNRPLAPATSMGRSNRPLAPAATMAVANRPPQPTTSRGVSNRPLAPSTSAIGYPNVMASYIGVSTWGSAYATVPTLVSNCEGVATYVPTYDGLPTYMPSYDAVPDYVGSYGGVPTVVASYGLQAFMPQYASYPTSAPPHECGPTYAPSYDGVPTEAPSHGSGEMYMSPYGSSERNSSARPPRFTMSSNRNPVAHESDPKGVDNLALQRNKSASLVQATSEKATSSRTPDVESIANGRCGVLGKDEVHCSRGVTPATVSNEVDIPTPDVAASPRIADMVEWQVGEELELASPIPPASETVFEEILAHALGTETSSSQGTDKGSEAGNEVHYSCPISVTSQTAFKEATVPASKEVASKSSTADSECEVTKERELPSAGHISPGMVAKEVESFTSENAAPAARVSDGDIQPPKQVELPCAAPATSNTAFPDTKPSDSRAPVAHPLQTASSYTEFWKRMAQTLSTTQFRSAAGAISSSNGISSSKGTAANPISLDGDDDDLTAIRPSLLSRPSPSRSKTPGHMSNAHESKLPLRSIASKHGSAPAMSAPPTCNPQTPSATLHSKPVKPSSASRPSVLSDPVLPKAEPVHAVSVPGAPDSQTTDAGPVHVVSVPRAPEPQTPGQKVPHKPARATTASRASPPPTVEPPSPDPLAPSTAAATAPASARRSSAVRPSPSSSRRSTSRSSPKKANLDSQKSAISTAKAPPTKLAAGLSAAVPARGNSVIRSSSTSSGRSTSRNPRSSPPSSDTAPQTTATPRKTPEQGYLKRVKARWSSQTRAHKIGPSTPIGEKRASAAGSSKSKPKNLRWVIDSDEDELA